MGFISTMNEIWFTNAVSKKMGYKILKKTQFSLNSMSNCQCMTTCTNLEPKSF